MGALEEQRSAPPRGAFSRGCSFHQALGRLGPVASQSPSQESRAEDFLVGAGGKFKLWMRSDFEDLAQPWDF